jgi:pimeloyl-ACP methyl ester carboxylesterase
MNEPLILLPGMMCDARLFTPQIEALSSSRPVMVMPMIGNSSVQQLAKAILDNSPPRFALLGLSMGGIVAMELIRQSPERVTRLALFDTNPKADTPERAMLRDQEIKRVATGELRAIIRDDMKPNYLSDGQHKGAILDLCMQMGEALGPQVFIQQSKALQNRPDQCGTLSDVQVPTLIACGEDDALCPLEKHELMHTLISGSQFCVIPKAGHLPTLEQPEKSNHIIEKWLVT